MIHHPLPLAPPGAATDSLGRYSPVHVLMLALSDRCNLRCDYCFVNKTSRKMSSETARKAVDFFLHRNISGVKPTVYISFFGGEPFIELDLMEEVMDYVRRGVRDTVKRVVYTATTNGTLAGPRVERLVRDSGMELLISLDGNEAATSHRPFEGGGSSYSIVARNLRTLASWASLAIVRMTFHPGSLDFVGNIRRALELGAPSVALAPVVEADWAGSEERLGKAYQDLADWFIEEARAGRILPLDCTWLLLRQVDFALSGGSRPARTCAVGTTILGVEPDGHVMPCHRFLYRPQDWLGTVDRPQLSGARNQYLDLKSSDILGCSKCLAKPVCGGGCRAVALEAGLTLQGSHPGHCLTTRAHALAAYRIYDTLMAEQNLPFRQVLRSRTTLGAALTELALR